jgi:hypothetical protein
VSRFSQLYIEQGAPLEDSARARLRVAKLLGAITAGNARSVSDKIESELGVPVGIRYAEAWPIFFGKCLIRDLLDSITIVHRYLTPQNSASPARWLPGIRRIFEEEHMAYAVDANGVVHPLVDAEFQRNRVSTVAGLQALRYANSLQTFERVSDELASTPPNGKEAWRAVFTAIEGLFRLMFPTPQLNASSIDTHLAPLVQRLYANDPIGLRATNKMLASFKDWTDASHFYRHEPGSEEPAQPPIDLAVLAISEGTSLLRWLVALDQATEAVPH